MNYWKRITGIQNGIGLAGLVLFIFILGCGISWGITCLIVYWISLLWANTIFAFTWSWEFASGIWLALSLLSGFINVRVKANDR